MYYYLFGLWFLIFVISNQLLTKYPTSKQKHILFYHRKCVWLNLCYLEKKLEELNCVLRLITSLLLIFFFLVDSNK